MSQGFTLPELLIGLALSLLVIVAATTAYGNSQHTWHAMAAADAVHANARIALRSIREPAQMAGAAHLQSSHRADGRFSVDVAAAEVIDGTGDSLTLSHWQVLEPMDCQGNTHSTFSTIRNDYKRNTNKELTCKDLNLPNSTYQALAEGVEDFQVRYAQVNPVAHTLQWRTANQVTAMSQVVALEVCVVVASITSIHSSKPSVKPLGCSGEALTSDGHLRRSFKRVMVLRNRDGMLQGVTP
jgi:prepilin-type N-terminal cleavage/methylation domain-containing protein